MSGSVRISSMIRSSVLGVRRRISTRRIRMWLLRMGIRIDLGWGYGGGKCGEGFRFGVGFVQFVIYLLFAGWSE